MDKVQLVAPTGERIIGAVAADGTLRAFEYSYDRTTMTRLYVLMDGTPLTDTPVMLEDASGKRWESNEVEWYTLFKHSV